MTDERTRILVVDDAEDTREVLRRNLTAEGHEVHTAPGVEEALQLLDERSVDLVITDLSMPRIGGMELVRHVRENLEDVEVVVITGYASIQGAVEAVKTGAVDYLAKPFTDDELSDAVGLALNRLRARRASRDAEDLAEAPTGLIGTSEPMRRVYRTIRKAARSLATVLITGESGTGKELVARAIHYASPRASAPFVPVNCGGIPDGLIESELFGHVKGAFTGAVASRAGFFQTAEGGTIFLDEIGEISLALQVKLLRVLQDKRVAMVGDDRSREVDVRIVAATNKDLGRLVEQNHFREDLYFRINVLTIELPPLRDRGDDVLLLVRYLAAKAAADLGIPEPRFTDRALELVGQYHWPGNVRELENLVQRLLVMVEGDEIDVADLPPPMRRPLPRGAGLDRSLAEVELEHIERVLASVGGNKTRAAEVLGIDRKTLRERLKPRD